MNLWQNKNYPITNKIIRPVEGLKSKAKRIEKNNENNENKDEGKSNTKDDE